MKNKKIIFNNEQKNFICKAISEFQGMMSRDKDFIGGVDCPMGNQLCKCEESGFKNSIDYYLKKLERLNHNIQFDEEFDFDEKK